MRSSSKASCDNVTAPSTSQSRIESIFAKAKAEQRCAVLPFIVAGDPDLETSASILAAIAAAGADLIELGVPYSDPLADGPSIIAASQRALESGATMDRALALAAQSPVPIVLFTYANPVIQYGVERLAQAMSAANVYGAIIPDLPLEETRAIASIFAKYHLELPLLIAPTTKAERARRIVAESSGFVYLVSRLGVTGAGSTLNLTTIEAQIMLLREMTQLPIAVGFGISQREHVHAVAEIADGAIIGSALIDAYSSVDKATAASIAGTFVANLLQGAQRIKA